jgi:hypothetical protein
VQVGDNVTVNYIGIFGTGPEQGKVFDTSLYAVATDNASYPKALSYHLRGAVANYTPLPVHVGSSTPSSGYSLYNKSFIQVVTGFWQGLVGLPGNVTHLVAVPVDLGYGPDNPACERTLPLVVRVPVVETIPGVQFTADYPDVVAVSGGSFVDPTYGYTVEILSANSTSVTLENVAYSGETADLQGWTTVVASVTSTSNGSGLITIENLLTGTDAGHIQSSTSSGLCTSSSNGVFIVSAVNQSAGTFTENFNQEVDGQVLDFEVTVVDIYQPVLLT